MGSEHRDAAPPDADVSERLARASAVLLLLAATPPAAVLVLCLTRISQVESVAQVVVFCVVPALITCTLLAVSRRGPSARLSTVVLLVTIGLSALFAELVLYSVGAIRSANQQPAQGLTIGEGVDSIRSEGGVAFPTIPGNVLVDKDATIDIAGRSIHPLNPSPANETTVLCNESGALVVYEADRFGFNNPDTVWSGDSIDVALLGDSYMHGVCVAPDQQPASLFAERFGTVNLGVRGSGPLFQLGVLREFGIVLKPRTVVWVYYEGNDEYDLRGEVSRPWLTAYLESPAFAQGLPELEYNDAYGAWIDGLLEDVFDERSPRSVDLVPGLRSTASLSTLRQVAGFGVSFPGRTSRIGRLPEVMAAASRTVAGWGGEIVFVYLPSHERFRMLVGEGVPGRSQVLGAAREAGFEVVDLTARFAATGAPRRLWDSPRGHLTPQGYRLMVDAVSEVLEDSAR